jgi:hypothetical protein
MLIISLLVQLPGDYLVLQGKNILNLHFNYIGLEEKDPKTKKRAKGEK